MNYIKIFIAIIIINLLNILIAEASPMKFENKSTGGNACCWWIYAEGEITTETPNEFIKFMAKEKYPANIIVFNSDGGNLLSAIELGKLIRKFELNTDVGKIVDNKFGPDQDKGKCFSACAYAYLGGKERYLYDQSIIGVHRFYRKDQNNNLPDKKFSGMDLDITQRISANLILYLNEMGIDARVIGLADKAGPDDMYIINKMEASEYKITYTMDGWTNWKIEPYKNGLITYSKSNNGLFNLTLFCEKNINYLLLTAENNYDYPLNQLIDCSFDGYHPILGRKIHKNQLTYNKTNGKQYLFIKLPNSIDLNEIKLFQFGDYPRSCSLNINGNIKDFLDSRTKCNGVH